MSAAPTMAQPMALARPIPVQVARPSIPNDPAKVMKAAKDFEAMVLGEFLKPMFEAPEPKKNPFGGGAGERTWKPMLIDEIGKQIAASGGLGLAAPIHAAMLRMQQGTQQGTQPGTQQGTQQGTQPGTQPGNS